MRLQKRITSYEDIDPRASEIMALREAAQLLSIGLSGITGLVDRNTLTEIIDADAIEKGRQYSTRFVYRHEVEALKARRDEHEQSQP